MMVRGKRRGRAILDRRRECICLQPLPGVDHFYEIGFEQCRTPEQIAEWIDHLLRKNWGLAVLPDFLWALMETYQGSRTKFMEV